MELAASRKSVVRDLSVAAVLLVTVIWTQWRLNAYAAEFLVDEPYHLVSGLFVHDYLVRALGQNPLAYLRNYHGHYPLVGIGHWGPVFYGVEAVWLLLMPAAKWSLLLLAACCAATLAWAIYRFAARRIGLSGALFAAFGFVLCAIVQTTNSELLLDMPVALVCFAAMLAYERYLVTLSAGWSVVFGLVAAFGMLIKGNAMALALMPPLRILLGGQYRVMLRWSFWLPVPIVLILAGPWYVMTIGLVTPGFRFEPGFDFVWTAMRANGGFLLVSLGSPVLLALMPGLTVLRRARLEGPLALSLAVAAFQLAVPAAIQERYLIVLLPSLLILAGAGGTVLCDGVARRLKGVPVWPLAPVLFAVLLAIVAVRGADALVKPVLHLGAAADQIRAALPPGNPVVLVATDISVENGMIAELALRDPRRPSVFAVRGSRLLGAGGFNTDEYEPRWRTPQEVMAALDDYAIPLVLFRRHIADHRRGLVQRDLGHIRQLAAAMTMFPERWELIYRDDGTDPEILVFRVRGNFGRPIDVAKLLAVTAPKGL